MPVAIKRKSARKGALKRTGFAPKRKFSSAARIIKSKIANSNLKKYTTGKSTANANDKALNFDDVVVEVKKDAVGSLNTQADDLEKKRFEMEKSLALMLQKRTKKPELLEDDAGDFDISFTSNSVSLQKKLQDKSDIENLRWELNERKEVSAREKAEKIAAWNQIEIERNRLEAQRIELEKRTVSFAKKLERQDELEENKVEKLAKKNVKYEIDVAVRESVNDAVKGVNTQISMISGAISTKIDKMQQFLDIDFTDVRSDTDILKNEMSQLKEYLKQLLSNQLESRIDHAQPQSTGLQKVLDYDYDEECDDGGIFDIADHEKIAEKKTVFSVLFNQGGIMKIRSAL